MNVQKRAWLLAIGLAVAEATADAACLSGHCAGHGPRHGSWCSKGTMCILGVTEIPRARCRGRKLGLDRRVVVAMYLPGKDVPAAAVSPSKMK